MGVNGYVSRRQNGTTGYLFKDAHGDVLSIYTSTSNKAADYTYDAWGEIQTKNESSSFENNPLRYYGQYYDYESDMTYLRARYYDSSIKRFITEDPAKDGSNWYAYCGNNPVMMFDPSGLANVPKGGTNELVNLLANIVELMDNQINYCNIQVKDPSSSKLSYFKSQANNVREKIKNNPSLDSSPTLKTLINDVVCNDTDPSLQKISSVLGVVKNLISKVIEKKIYEGEQIVSEDEVIKMYNKYDESDKIYVTSAAYYVYNVGAGMLINNLLVTNRKVTGNYEKASGFDVRKIYYDVINLDYAGYSFDAYEAEDLD